MLSPVVFFQVIDSPNIIEYCIGFFRNRPNWVNGDEPYQGFSVISLKVGDHIQKMSFEIGESMEVIGNEDGMEGSYFKGKVIDRSPGRRTIRYDTLIVEGI
ncbi:hypothetical protein LXL04_021217 [Taraxacum kok-saghyz]